MGGDFISRDELAKKAIRYEIAGYKTAQVVLLKDVLELQAANVQPVVPGTWVQNEDLTVNACSECGYSFSHEGYVHFFNFCPNCGADMRDRNE